MEKDIIKEYFKNSTKYLDGASWKAIENSLIYREVPFTGVYTIPMRIAEGSGTYFWNYRDNMHFIGKYIGYATPDILRFQGLPIPDVVNAENLVKSAKKVVDLLKMDKRVEILLNENELKILIKVLGNVPCEIEYFDSDFYDNIDDYITKHSSGRGKDRLRGMLKDENITCREVVLDDYPQLKNILSEFRKEKLAKKDWHRDGFYNRFIADWELYGFKLYGLYYKNILLYAVSYWTSGNVMRSDVGFKIKDINFYDEHNIPKKYVKAVEYTLKYKLFLKMREGGIKFYSVDGVGYANAKKGSGLRTYKTERYGKEMKIYRLKGRDI